LLKGLTKMVAKLPVSEKEWEDLGWTWLWTWFRKSPSRLEEIEGRGSKRRRRRGGGYLAYSLSLPLRTSLWPLPGTHQGS
jgi:hypothetical protein